MGFYSSLSIILSSCVVPGGEGGGVCVCMCVVVFRAASHSACVVLSAFTAQPTVSALVEFKSMHTHLFFLNA